MNYLIVLFKNKKRKKILNKFVTLDKAKSFFEKNQNENLSITFDVKVENGKICDYELGLLEKNSLDFQPFFIKDDLGRQLQVNLEDSEYKVIKLIKYRKEELIYHYKSKNKITFEFFVNKFLRGNGLKLISKINNKIIVQNDNEVEVFSLKTCEDCERFSTILQEFLFDKKRIDCLIVNDVSKTQKKYLYDLLEEKGIEKSFLYRTSTTYFKK